MFSRLAMDSYYSVGGSNIVKSGHSQTDRGGALPPKLTEETGTGTVYGMFTCQSGDFDVYSDSQVAVVISSTNKKITVTDNAGLPVPTGSLASRVSGLQPYELNMFE